MEMPIQVTIVLFVAVVVGGFVILFSQQLLGQAKDNIVNIDAKDVEKDHILEIDVMNAADVLALASQCARDNYGTFDDKTCYAVFANSVTLPQTGAQLPNNFTLQVEATSASTTLLFTYMPTSATVRVR